MTVINTNRAGIAAQLYARKSAEQTHQSIERLTTGTKLVSSADDAAGMAVANKIRANIKSTEMAYRNAANGISLTQVADTGLSEIKDMVIRMKELSLQMSNGLYTDSDYDNATYEFEELRAEVFRIVEETRFNGIQLLDGTYQSRMLTGASDDEVLEVLIEGLKLEKTITGRITATGDSITNIRDQQTAAGVSQFNTPQTSQATGSSAQVFIPSENASVSTASRYIGGGFQNGDFDNVTISTSGNVDSFAGWEAHRRQVMLGPNADFLNAVTTLSANETTGAISTDETVLTSIKAFSDLNSSTTGSFSLSSAQDGDLFTFTDNGDGTFDLVSGAFQEVTVSGIAADLSSASNGDNFSIDIAGTGTITTAALSGISTPGSYTATQLASALNTANAAMLTPAAVTFSADGNNLLVTATAKGASSFTASNFAYNSSASGSVATSRAGIAENALTSSTQQQDTLTGIAASLTAAENGDSFSIDIAGTGTITTAPLSGISTPGSYTATQLASALTAANAAMLTPAAVTFSASGNDILVTANTPGAAAFTASNFQFTDSSTLTTTAPGSLSTTTAGSTGIDADADGVYDITLNFTDNNGQVFTEQIALTVNSNGSNPVPPSSAATGTSVSDIEYGVIDGYLTPTDTTPTPSNPNNALQVSDGDGDVVSSPNLNFQITGGMARLWSSMTVNDGGDVFHGPYLISDNTVSLNTGDDVEFDFRAQGGSDAFDVYAYLLETSTGNTIELMNQTGVGTSDTGIMRISERVTATGDYKFVFISGTFDETFGRAAGASLYIDNVDVVRNSVPSAVRAGIVTAEVDLTAREAQSVTIGAGMLAKLNGYALSDGKLGTYSFATTGTDYTNFSIDNQGNITSNTPLLVSGPQTFEFDVQYTSADMLTIFTETVRLTVTQTFDAEGSFEAEESSEVTITAQQLTLANQIATSDGFAGTFQLQSTTGDHNSFTVDTSGGITSSTALDHDTQSRHEFDLVYVASDSRIITEKITLDVLDTLTSTTSLSSEEAKRILLDEYSLSSLHEYAEKDDYAGSFSLAAVGDEDKFTISSQGVISSDNEIRISPQDEFSLEAIYTDSDGHIFTDSIDLSVTPSTLNQSRSNLVINEGSLLELLPGRLSHLDAYASADDYEGRFEMVSSAHNPDDYTLFEVSSRGKLTGDFKFDYESGKIHYSFFVRYLHSDGTSYFDEEVHLYLEDDPTDNNILTFEEVNITTREEAIDAEDVISEVVSRINEAQSKLGAMQNRLSHNLTELNFRLLESQISLGRITDADFAAEAVKLAKQQILNSAATDMLTQANQSIRSVLTLIGAPSAPEPAES